MSQQLDLIESETGYLWPTEFWPHQLRGCESVVKAIMRGDRRIVLTAPTGAGKSKMMVGLIEWGLSERSRSVLYTNRRMLFSQISGVLDKHGIEHGLRAAGHKPALLRDIQLAMTPSEFSAVFKRKSRDLHPAQLVLTDELHCQGGEMMPHIHGEHYRAGAAIVGITATPLDLVGDWDRLIVACTTSEARKCGALVPAVTYCPDQPDLKHIKNYRVGEDLTDKQNRSAMMRPGVFGRVLKHFEILNPDHKPTLLFGPDVAGSMYFAEQFTKNGVRAAHIDAKQIWLDGEYIPSDDENRARLLKMTETGEVKVLCNRFVLREGIDLPHIAHCIFACVFGSLKTYLQAGGRALRAHPSMTEVTIQDHGGNYVRHSSLNADRDWELGQSGYVTTGLRQDMMRERPEMEPIICPKCGAARLSGPTCHKCGHTCHRRSRVVVQIDGKLRQVEGPSFKPHRVKLEPDTEKKWMAMYYRAKSKKWDATFNQARALFFHENHYYPPENLPFMPTDMRGWYSKVAQVPRDKLL